MHAVYILPVDVLISCHSHHFELALPTLRQLLSFVHDFGIYIDSDVSMKSHVTKTVSACFAVLYQLRSVRQSIPRFVLPRGRTTEMQPLPAFSRTC